MSQVYTALVFPLILLVGQAIVALGQRKISQRMDEGQAKTDAKRKAEAEWRDSIDAKLDTLNDATQTTMRTQLLHMSEKYLTRGWVTSEERAALCDMHEKYAALHANGYIDGYMKRVEQLPDKEI